MVKQMISFTLPQQVFLKREAKRLHVSMAEIVRRIIDAHMSTAKLVLILACLAGGCASPTAPTHDVAILETNGGRVTFECWNNICHFFGGGINKGKGCATNVHGTVTVRTSDGVLFTSASWTLPANRIIPAGDTFGFEGPTTRNTFPEQNITDITFAWTDVPCR